MSHDGEGILGGRAVAAGVAAAMVSHSPDAVVQAALSVVPDDSWTARSLHRAVSAARRARRDPDGTQLSMERVVRKAVVIGGYPWTDLAPEAVGLAFGAFAVAWGDFRESVLTAVNMGRDADTTAAVAGALTGALDGAGAFPQSWREACRTLAGCALPRLAGTDLISLAERLAATSSPIDSPSSEGIPA